MAAIDASRVFEHNLNGWCHVSIPPYVQNRIVIFEDGRVVLPGVYIEPTETTLYYSGNINVDGTVTDKNGKFMRADGSEYTLIDGELIKVVCDPLDEISIPPPPPGKFERQVTGSFSCNVYDNGTLSCNNPQANVGQLQVCGEFCGTPGKYKKDPEYTDGCTRDYWGDNMSGVITMNGTGYMYYLHAGVIGPWKI